MRARQPANNLVLPFPGATQHVLIGEQEHSPISWSRSRRAVLEQCPRRYYYDYYAIRAECVPPLWIDSVALAKPDHQHEAINPVMLADTLLELFRRTKPLKFEPLDSLLILRDGHTDGNELNALLKSVRPMLVTEGYLRSGAPFDIFDFHKKSAKSIRLWEVDGVESATNTPEGVAVELNAAMAVVATTGSATLHQGSAQPFILVSRSGNSFVLDAAHSTFDAAQMNFSSPRVAQRLPLTFQRTDEELSARASQEIRCVR